MSAKKPGLNRVQVVKKPLAIRKGNNAIQKRSTASSANKLGNRKPGQARRGLGQRKGKTLSLAPKNAKR